MVTILTRLVAVTIHTPIVQNIRQVSTKKDRFLQSVSFTAIIELNLVHYSFSNMFPEDSGLVHHSMVVGIIFNLIFQVKFTGELQLAIWNSDINRMKASTIHQYNWKAKDNDSMWHWINVEYSHNTVNSFKKKA